MHIQQLMQLKTHKHILYTSQKIMIIKSPLCNTLSICLHFTTTSLQVTEKWELPLPSKYS